MHSFLGNSFLNKSFLARYNQVCRRAFYLPLLFCAVAVIASCQGPQGAQGPAGPPGVPGAPGPSAQVVNITVTTNEWRPVMASGVAGAYLQSGLKPAPNITQNIINSGAVLVYMRASEANAANQTWQQLPITLYGSSTIFQVIDAQFQVGQVQVFINQSNTVAPNPPSGTLTFRVVAIAGTTITNLSQQMDIGSYQSVASAFHLAD